MRARTGIIVRSVAVHRHGLEFTKKEIERHTQPASMRNVADGTSGLLRAGGQAQGKDGLSNASHFASSRTWGPARTWCRARR